MAFDLTQKMLSLRHLWAMSSLGQSDLRMVAEKLHERYFPAGHVLYRDGDPVNAMHFLLDGTIHLRKGDKTFGTVEAPGGVGIMTVLARSESPYDTVAATDLLTLEIDAEVFLEILEDRFPVLHNTLRISTAMLSKSLSELPASELGSKRAPDCPVIGDRPLDIVERLLFVRRIPLYRNTSTNALAEMAQLLVEERFADGTVLFRRGESADRVFFVLRGAIRCTAEQGEFSFEAGSVVGGLEALAGVPRWYGAEASDSLVVLRGLTTDVIDVYEDNPALALDFLAMSSGRNLQFWLRKAQATLERDEGPSRGVSLYAQYRPSVSAPPPR
ncbi:MAG: cyclic nucleotide-binding domain-containing protein [Deltaproteobacteria bacterium]|nr:cyclic nucleotide-binding domain-containing protein [Deltaproteobacteria bacterium]